MIRPSCLGRREVKYSLEGTWWEVHGDGFDGEDGRLKSCLHEKRGPGRQVLEERISEINEGNRFRLYRDRQGNFEGIQWERVP